MTAATFMLFCVIDMRQLHNLRDGPPFGYTSLNVVDWTASPCSANGFTDVGANSPDATAHNTQRAPRPADERHYFSLSVYSSVIKSVTALSLNSTSMRSKTGEGL